MKLWLGICFKIVPFDSFEITLFAKVFCVCRMNQTLPNFVGYKFAKHFCIIKLCKNKNSYYDLHENIALMRTQYTQRSWVQLAQKYKHAYWAAGGQTVIARLLAFPGFISTMIEATERGLYLINN